MKTILPIMLFRKRPVERLPYNMLNRFPTMTNWQIKDITPEAWAKSQRAPLRKAA